MPPPPPPPPPTVQLTPELQRYLDLLGTVDNASKALFVGPDDQVVSEAPVKEMIDALAALSTSPKAVVFDGVVSQRLLDVAHERGVGLVVASRIGAIGKLPEGVRVVTRADLQGTPMPR